MAQTSSNARDQDLLGEGTTSGAKKAKNRPVSADGLKYLDTGEATPLAIRRQQAISGQVKAGSGASGTYVDTNFNPATTKNPDAYKYDAQKGLYYTEVKPGTGGAVDGKLYVTNNDQGGDAPIFTANNAPKASKDYTNVLRNGAGLAAAGSAGGVAGALAGGVVGALSGLPGASGRGIYLTAGDPSQMPAGQRIGTAAEAAQANANYAATGNSVPPGGGNNYFPTSQAAGAGGGIPNVPIYTPSMGTNGGSALSAEAQRIVSQAGQMAQASQAQANNFYGQAAAAGQRAAPQMALPSSANQQAVYDRAMGFQAQSGADAIRAAQADTSGANRLENYQLDQQGINNLESFQNTNSQQGVNALNSYDPTNAREGLGNVEGFYASQTNQSADQLANFRSTNALAGADRLNQFGAANGADAASQLLSYRPQNLTTAAAQNLGNFQSDRSGIDALNAFNPDMTDRDRLRGYADEAQGPSAAQALLRAQADADTRSALALSRSGRGGPAAQAQAQRQAISEGAAIAGETRGQAAALSAQEYDTYKQRQLSAMGQAGSLTSQADAQRLNALANAGSQISAAEAQRLSAMQASGQLLSEQDAQKLSALQAYAQVQSQRDAQILSAQQAAGQLQLGADTNALSGQQSAGQLRAAGDQMRLSGMQSGLQARSAMDAQRLSATTSAAGLQGDMDQRTLGAISTAAGLRTQGDAIQSQNLQAAGNIRLQGSEINQRGAIAASAADLQAQALNLQSLSLAGQVSSDIRNQDINVLRSNLDASLQTLGLNDNQVRFFSQLGSDREVASQNLQQQAAAIGINAQQAQQALNLQWEQFGLSALSQQQQTQYNYAALQQAGQLGNAQIANQSAQIAQQGNAQQFAQQQQNRNNTYQTLGSLFTAASTLIPKATGSSNTSSLIAPVQGLSQTNMAGQSTSQPSGYNSMGMVYDPFTGQYVYPSN